MKTGLFERSLEWEPLAHPTTYEHISFASPPFVPGTRKMTIRRDDELRLEILVEGTMPPGEFKERRAALDQIQAGTFLDPIEFEFDAYMGSTCSLRAHLQELPDIAFNNEKPGTHFTQPGRVDRFRRRWAHGVSFPADADVPEFPPLGPGAWRSDWFANAPHGPVYFRPTTRRRTAKFRRERDFLNISADEPPAGGGTNYFDHLVVEANGIRFALSKVPEEHAPSWCNPASLDFLAPIPDEETREAVAEIVSFVVGRRLMQVGSTLFDGTGNVIEEEVMNPWGQGLQVLCAQGDIRPLPISPNPSGDTEELLTQLVPRYLVARKPLRLKDALLTYWLANEAFSGIDLALYGSAVEALKNGWFGSNRSESGGVWMPEREFSNLLGDLVTAARGRLAANNAPAAIGNKIAGAFRMGGGEQLAAFFDELGLAIGDAERAAIKARNGPAHGGLRAGADQRELIRHGTAYRTLFERTFLKMIGYDGAYVDRTALGHPARPLDDPCSGSASGSGPP